ncbi:polyhydroxybutyrate depolymerase [Cribrihabitans marinus]|uniref:Polyhydroxybutyrate depolymerase n=1 Tax=Cribrihabitans marinus TaxID=1227549 RepID=A0A1H7CWP2_9RHOB|nr:polyhydroxybutyrate depolymerase [Cribrihabitans marinus]GGH36804.1 hypothetical protein GCM10010973_30950 [Cribrihabitans marinus]SEJ94009.1 polyhydroxybutyrate depolymerase [Cribrihabitans marinus]
MIRLVLIPLLFWAVQATANGCGGQTACPLGDRSYHVLEPDGWDGQTPLPVLLHFHGWQRQGDLVVKHPRIAGATRLRGVLLVAPNGRRKTWDFWTADTEDVGFAALVLEDVARRYPVDRARIYVSGYSYGAAMAWRYACQNGNGVAALLAVAGTLSQDEPCPQAPREVRHVHGLKDTVMDFPMGPGGDTTHPVALWRRKLDCGSATPAGDWQVKPFLVLTRTEWSDCAKGRVTLDLHPGGHFIPHGWIGRQLDELLGRTPSYP